MNEKKVNGVCYKNIREIVGRRIAECRKNKGIKQKELANILGKSIATIQRYESGDIDLSLSLLAYISNALDISIDYLIGCKPLATLETLPKEISAKDIYIWRHGEDDYGIKILSALNKIIEGLTELTLAEWENISDRIGSSARTIAKSCDNVYTSDELMEMTMDFERIRTLLFGDKINYTMLLDVLRENVDECGWTIEKAAKKREELENKSAKCDSEFTGQMPERIKKQREDFNDVIDNKEKNKLSDNEN